MNKIVKYTASWCAPCKSLDPILDSISDEYAIEVERIDIETHEGMNKASENGIRALPTIHIIDNDEIIFKHSGSISKQELENEINGKR